MLKKIDFQKIFECAEPFCRNINFTENKWRPAPASSWSWSCEAGADEKEGQSEKSYTDEETGEETEEESSENYDESEEEDNNLWKLILNEVHQKMDAIRDASIDKTMQEDEITHEEAPKHVYDALMPAYTKELMKVYKKYIRLLKGLQRDSTHRKI